MQNYVMYIFWFSVEKYLASGKGELCSDNGHMGVDDMQTCIAATASLNKNFKKEENVEKWPTGCYLIDDLNAVYFNQHPAGSRHERARQICKPGGGG